MKKIILLKNAEQVKSHLMNNDLTISDWAKTHGFSRRVVSNVIHRWAGRAGVPRGQTALIVRRLEETIGLPIIIKP